MSTSPDTSTATPPPGRPVAPPAVDVDEALVDPHLAAFVDTDPTAAEEYNRLAVAFVAAAEARGCRRVLVASAKPGDGRTSVTLNLACVLARAGRRVLAVDADLLRPGLLRLLGVEVAAGIGDVLARGGRLEEAVVRLLPYGFDLLASRAPSENSLAILAAEPFLAAAERLAAAYDFVLFDSAPLLVRPDAKLLASLTDATLLVVRAGVTDSDEMARAATLLEEGRILGVVLTHAGR